MSGRSKTGIIRIMLAMSILLYLGGGLYSAEQDSYEEQYDRLVSAKKYLSAYNLLEKADPKNNDEKIILLKTDLCTNYFAKSLDHKLFALVDLKEGESLQKIRSEANATSIVNFSPEEELLRRIEKNEANKNLHHKLGVFYYEKLLYFAFSMDAADQQKYKDLSSKYLQIAHDSNVSDWYSYFILGYLALEKRQISEANVLLLRSIEMKPSEGINNYNYAYSCMLLEKYDLALKHAEIARQNYREVTFKTDACYFAFRMTLVLKKREESMRYAKMYFVMDPENPQIIRNIVQDYLIAPYAQDVLVFIDAMQKEFPKNQLVQANTRLYRGLYYIEKSETGKARDDVARAKEIYVKMYKPDHVVLQFIVQVEAQLDSMDKK